MRHGNFWAVLAIMVLAGCTSSKSLKDMVGYVPPTSLPAQPKRTLVADSETLVWTQLVDFLGASAFEIDHIDEEERLLIARYSGNPEPYIDCGSIVTHQGGTLGQIAGSSPTVALNYEIEQEPVILNRTLNLDSRIIIRLRAQPQGTVIETDTTYVVTKTIDVADASGGVSKGSRESVSFEAGRRGEFSKGTACQPNGSLDLAVLKSLPNIVGSDEIDRADLPADGALPVARARPDNDTVATLPPALEPKALNSPSESNDEGRGAITEDLEGLDAGVVPPPDGTTFDWVLPETGLPSAALPAPDSFTPSPRPQTAERNLEAPPTRDDQLSPAPVASDPVKKGQSEPVPNGGETVVLVPEATGAATSANAAPSDTIVDDTTRKLLDSLDCGGDEWHFCDLVEVTTPYRKRNIEKLFGLTINTTESFTSQIVGRDLKLDILFPSFPSYLHIAYARRDGTVDHVISSPDVWPADLAHQFAEADRTIPGPDGLAMIIAIATDEPLFSEPPDRGEEAVVYLDRLKQRLTELEADSPTGSIAASQLLIYVESADT